MTYNLDVLKREVEKLENHWYFKTTQETLLYRKAYESLAIHPEGDKLAREVIDDIFNYKQKGYGKFEQNQGRCTAV